MLARITHLQFHPDKAEQGFEVVRQSIVPSIKEQRGFKGILPLHDRETGEPRRLRSGGPRRTWRPP